MRLTDLRLSTEGLWNRAFLVLGSLGLLLGVVEVGLRVFSPVRWVGRYHADWDESKDEELLRKSEVPGLAYELVPDLEIERWGDEVRINGAGMRDRPPVENLPDSVARILVLGDEVAFGRMVGQESCFPTLLEDLLNGGEFRPGCEFEVLNMGVSGYGVRDAVRVLEYKGLAYDPDVVLLAYRLDDPESDDLQPMKVRLDGVPWWKHFHVGRLLSQRLLERAVRRHGDGDYFEYLHAEDGAGWGRVTRSFELLRRLAHDREGHPLPVIVLLVPALRGFEDWAEYPYLELHARIAKAAREAGLSVLDLAPQFGQGGATLAEFSDGANLPNAEGHRRLALAVRQRLLDLYPCLAVR